VARLAVLTAADFRLDDDKSGIGALLDSVSNQHHRTLREKAQQNIIAVLEAVTTTPALRRTLQEIVGALWLRSIAIGNLAGAEPATLHVDITRARRSTTTPSQVELATIVENSFNIHQEGSRLVFREEENPRAKLMACARNDKLFGDTPDQRAARQAGALRHRWHRRGCQGLPRRGARRRSPGQTIRGRARRSRAARTQWDDRIPSLVLPKSRTRSMRASAAGSRTTCRSAATPCASCCRATAARTLLRPRPARLARAEMKAQEWSGQNPEYKKLHKEYERELRDILKKRFDRFAILHRWNFADPAQCKFSVESLKKQGAQIPEKRSKKR
jgi:hypothetical protein